MEKRFSQKTEQENVVRTINDEVKMYAQKGASLPQAISVVCRKHNFNPYNLIDIFYPEIKPEDLTAYKDIKTEEGSFVVLKGDSSKKQYEVININNKDAIVLRDTDNNKEITASEEEITPVITENEMNKLNEAQYNISINGLETEDAATLSQMLSLASQAETSVEPMGEDMTLQSEMDMNPMPVDDMGMPMDMEEPIDDIETPMDMEEPIDDIEFDEEMPEDEMISLDTDANAYANPEIDTAVVPVDSLEDFGYESSEDMSMDDMMDAGMYDEFDESMDFDKEIAEALRIAGVELNETKEIIPAGDDVDEEIVNEEVNESMNDKEQIIKICKEMIGTELPSIPNFEWSSEDYKGSGAEIYGSEDNPYCLYINDTDFDGENTDYDVYIGIENQNMDDGEIREYFNIPSDMSQIKNKIKKVYNKLHEIVSNNEIAESLKLSGVQLDESSDEFNEHDREGSEDELGGEQDKFAKEIAEALRIAGVELNEEIASDPSMVTIDTLPINDDEEEEDQEYHQIDTMGFGKEASEGTKPTMTFESAINTKKITAIYETAKSMYAKKDTKDWMSLDRRYVEKLIKEGVSYEKASKMIMNAKKGK